MLMMHVSECNANMAKMNSNEPIRYRALAPPLSHLPTPS